MILLLWACEAGNVHRIEAHTQRLEVRAVALRKELSMLQRTWERSERGEPPELDPEQDEPSAQDELGYQQD